MARQPAALQTQDQPPLAGGGDHNAAGHAEGRRSGVGCSFGLGVGDDGAEAEAHGAGTVDEKDTWASQVRTHAAVDLSVSSGHAKRQPETCRGHPSWRATWSVSWDAPAPDADRLLTSVEPSSL